MPAEAKTCRLKDGRELTFLFDIDGICAAEDAGGVGIKLLLIGAMAYERQGYLTALVYGGLKAHHPEISRADAYALVIGPDSKEVGKVLGQALDAAFPEAQAKAPAANPRKAATGTGSPSSPRGSKKGSTKRASGSRPRAATPSS